MFHSFNPCPVPFTYASCLSAARDLLGMCCLYLHPSPFTRASAVREPSGLPHKEVTQQVARLQAGLLLSVPCSWWGGGLQPEAPGLPRSSRMGGTLSTGGHERLRQHGAPGLCIGSLGDYDNDPLCRPGHRVSD